MSDLMQTPLSQWHRDRGARMVPFAGFEMPVQYEGVLAEPAAVRKRKSSNSMESAMRRC